MTTPRMSDHVELRPGAYADSVTLLQVSRDRAGRTRRASPPRSRWPPPLNVEVLAEMGFDVPDGQPQRHGRRAAARGRRRRSTGALAAVDAALAAAVRRPSGASEARARRARPRRPCASAARRARAGLGARRQRHRRGDGRARRRPRRDGLQRQRAGRAGGRAQARRRRARPAGDGPRLRHRRRRRRSAWASPTPCVPGPVGIVAASGTGCQQLLALLDHAGVGVDVGPRRRRPRPVRRGRRARHPRGPAPARRRPDGRADRAGLQAARARGRRRDRGVRRRRWARPVELALLGRRPARPDRGGRGGAATGSGRDVPDLAGRRHGTRGAGHLLRGLFVGGTLLRRACFVGGTTLPGAAATSRSPTSWPRRGRPLSTPTRSSTSATTPTPPGRAHPMIDPTLRLEHLARAAADPAHRRAPARRGARATAPSPTRRRCWRRPSPRPGQPGGRRRVVGTAHDPQDRDRQVRRARRRRRRGPPVQRRGHPPRRRAAGGHLDERPPMTDPPSSPSAPTCSPTPSPAQAVAVTRVDWRPPMPGTEADLAAVADRPAPADANARALAAMLGVQADLVDVAPASRGARPRARPVPARRPADRAGTAPPARCAAR